MTDVSTAGSGAITITPDQLRKLGQEIAGLDEQLMAASGEAGGKIAVRNQLAKDHAPAVAPLATEVITRFDKALETGGEDVLIGAFFALRSALDEKYGTQMEKRLQVLAEERKSTQPQVPEEQVKALRETRKQKRGVFGILKEALLAFGQGEAIANIPDPKVLKGGVGPRSPQVWTKYYFRLDGTLLEGGNNNLKYIATTLGMKVSDLKKEMEKKELTAKNAPANWEVEINGRKISASVMPEFEGDWKEETDEDEDEEEEATVASGSSTEPTAETATPITPPVTSAVTGAPAE